MAERKIIENPESGKSAPVASTDPVKAVENSNAAPSTDAVSAKGKTNEPHAEAEKPQKRTRKEILDDLSKKVTKSRVAKKYNPDAPKKEDRKDSKNTEAPESEKSAYEQAAAHNEAGACKECPEKSAASVSSANDCKAAVENKTVVKSSDKTEAKENSDASSEGNQNRQSVHTDKAVVSPCLDPAKTEKSAAQKEEVPSSCDKTEKTDAVSQKKEKQEPPEWIKKRLSMNRNFPSSQGEIHRVLTLFSEKGSVLVTSGKGKDMIKKVPFRYYDGFYPVSVLSEPHMADFLLDLEKWKAVLQYAYLKRKG